MKECGLATIWRVWATNAFRGPRPVAWGQNILMLTGVQKTIIIVIIIIIIIIIIIKPSIQYIIITMVKVNSTVNG